MTEKKLYSQRYIFVHIPKTGGTTFNFAYLPFAFPKSETFILSGNSDESQNDINKLINFSKSDKEKIKIIAGHNTFGLHTFFPKSKYISIFRNPIDQATSSYLHQKYHKPGSNDAKYININNISLTDYIKPNFNQRGKFNGPAHQLDYILSPKERGGNNGFSSQDIKKFLKRMNDPAPRGGVSAEE